MNIIACGGRGWDCNQFLVKDPKSNRYDLVDAGHGMDHENVLEEISTVVDPHRITRVVVTHEHLDHVNGLPKWRALGAKLVAAEATAAKLHDGHDVTSARFGMDIPRLDVDEVPMDGDVVELGGQPFTFLATPGHSPGSACYYHEGKGVLFSGDTLFADGGIGRFDFPDGDLDRLAASVRRLHRLTINEMHCGHGLSVVADASRHVTASLRHVEQCLAQR